VSRKPSDILDFLRRSSPEELPEPEPALEQTPRMVVLRRSQVVVAAAAGALALVLAFLLGLALGGSGDGSDEGASDVGVWVLRVVTYRDDERGQEYAQSVKSQLIRRKLGDEVNLRRFGEGQLAVTVGAWLQAPQDNPQAQSLKRDINEIQDRNGANPFKDAKFWLIRR